MFLGSWPASQYDVCPPCRDELLWSLTIPPPLSLVYTCWNCDREQHGEQHEQGFASPLPWLNHGSAEVGSQSPEGISSGSNHSRSSTPQTETSSPIGSASSDIPPETEETCRRRQQSDAAFTEIEKRLAKGWSMLSEECPNDTCYDVPLVRLRKPGSEMDPRMECVICSGVYVHESGWRPSEDGNQTMAPDQPATSSQAPRMQSQSNITNLSPPAVLPSGVINQVVQSAPSRPSPLEISSRSLELTLQKLSAKLLFLSSGHVPMETKTITSIANAISRVTEALVRVRQLQSNQHQIL